MECEACLYDGFFGATIMMAAFHTLLLACILFFSKKLNAKSNKYLSLCLFGIFVILFYEFADYVDIIERIPNWILLLPIYLRTTIPIGIYFFTLFIIHPDHTFSRSDKFIFLALLIEIILQLCHIYPDIFLEDLASQELIHDRLDVVEEGFGILVSLILLPMALRMVNQYQKYLYGHYSTTRHKSLRWLRNFILLVLILIAIWAIAYFFMLKEDWGAYESTFVFLNLGIILLMFWIGYFIILYHNWFQIVPLPDVPKLAKVGSNRLSAKTDTYHQGLLRLIREERLYEDVELTLESLAQRLQISAGYLSQIINEKEAKTFFEFVNFYRIEAVKEKLLDEEFRNYTIMGIALESGFKSKSTFNSVFKKFTGQTPSAYKRLQKQV